VTKNGLGTAMDVDGIKRLGPHFRIPLGCEKIFTIEAIALSKRLIDSFFSGRFPYRVKRANFETGMVVVYLALLLLIFSPIAKRTILILLLQRVG